MTKQVLVLNSGSSSIKFHLYTSENDALTLKIEGQIEGLGHKALFVSDVSNAPVNTLAEDADHALALQFLLNWLQGQLDSELQLLVGHRVVHGGLNFRKPVLISSEILTELKTLIPLAPLHQPHNLAAIEILQDLYPELLQVACFDTAFHAHHKKPIDQFALPHRFYDQGVRRYGFHGLSYEFISEELRSQAPRLFEGKCIVAHLGNGASLCALRQGQSIDSTMGFSALEGLPMGTRCGSIDAGVILYLLQEEKMDKQQLSDLLYKQSGLLGVSGLSHDMRELLNSNEPAADEAIELYVHRIAREVGALIAVLEGLDGLVFTGGIGENADVIRERVCNKLGWIGARLDKTANRNNAPCISTADSGLDIHVIPTNEELMIARHTITAVR